jgi:hypothetical protein
MLIPKTYSCGICKTQPDQISHHKTHILTQKHKDKYELFELKLSKLSEEQLLNKYNTIVFLTRKLFVTRFMISIIY